MRYRYYLILLSALFSIVFSSCTDQMLPINTHEKAEWISEAYAQIKTQDRIKAVSYWNENWKDDYGDVLMKINSSKSSESAFQKALSDDYFIADVKIKNGKIIPTEGKCYNGAFLGKNPNHLNQSALKKEIEAFEFQSGKSLSMITCSSIWTDQEGGINVPVAALQNTHDQGKVPIMYIEPWTRYDYTISAPDPKYNMQRIIDGDWDTEIIQMAILIKKLNIPIMAVFGHEVNGDWFPWNGKWNGGKKVNKFGEKNQADGPERFVAAQQHLINIFRDQKVSTVTWVAGFSFNTQPEEAWNFMSAYYAGDDYIDWIGLSFYGRKNQYDENQFSFSFLWNYIQPQLKELNSNKPIIILEMGVGE